MPGKQTQEQFIENASKKHNNRYDYSLVEYKNANIKVKIICSKHGVFEQQPNNHSFGQGCIECMMDNVRKARTSNTQEFIEKAKTIHGDRYDYSISDYIKANQKLIIICKKHNEFLQTPNSHLQGSGCPLCNISKGEDEIEKYLIKNKIEYIREHRIKECINPKTNKTLPFDFYIPQYNAMIEYHGEQHYKKTGYFEKRAGGLKGLQYRDKIKKIFCFNNKINYLEISYKEFNNINNILNQKLCV